MRRFVLLALLTGCSAQPASKLPECPVPTPTAPPGASSAPPAPSSSAIDTSFLRTYAATRGFRLGTPRNGYVAPDGKSVLFLRSKARDPKQSLFETDLATGATRELLSPDAVVKGPETLSPEEKARRERLRITASGFTSFQVTDDGAHVLLGISGRLFAFERATSKLVELPTGEGAVIDPQPSPDGKRVAYVRDYDVRVVSIDGKGKEASITKGGTEAVPHGLAEFVAQEEFARLRGFWWSPDSKQVLWEEADQTKVERFTIADLAHPEKAPDRPYYPRPGKANADVKLALADANGGKPTWIAWDRAKFPYVTHVVWQKHGPPAMYVMDRLQQSAQLLAIDPKSGKTTVLLEEHDASWINLDASCPVFLEDGSFLWSSERTGHWQLELREKDGKLVRALTDAKLGYRELLKVDPAKKLAFVAAASDPTERRLFGVSLDGQPPFEISTGAPFVLSKFGKRPDVFAGYEATREGGRAFYARSVDGKIAREIPSVAETPPKPNAEWTTAGPGDMRVVILRPKGFVAGRKYPVVDAAYGGPHVVVVTSDGSGFAREQWMADALDAIVVKIDAKGTPFRGREWERAIRESFHNVPIEGHAEAMTALAAKIPEMDLDRVGVFGWSFGGYFSALAVLAKPSLYKVGVAGAPVVDWRDYDTAYTERYLGLPDANKSVYDAADVTTWAKRAIAPDAPARPLLVFHGTADDNVYFSNSLKLADALAKAGRPFEFVPLPGQTHQLSSAEANELVWGRAVAFLRAHL